MESFSDYMWGTNTKKAKAPEKVEAPRNKEPTRRKLFMEILDEDGAIEEFKFGMVAKP